MVEPYRREWTISGLSFLCDRFTEHPYICSIIDEKFGIRFYPMGYDKSCGEYVSLVVFKPYGKNALLTTFKLSIKNNKKDNLFVKGSEIEFCDLSSYETIKKFIKRDYLLDPANGLTHDDEFILCFEGWLHDLNNVIPSNIKVNSELSRDYFDFSPLLYTKSLVLKWTIENFNDFFENPNQHSLIELPQFKDSSETDETIFRPRIKIIKHSYSNNNILMFDLKSNYKGLIVIETSVMDINQQKCHKQKIVLKSYIGGFIRNFLINKEIYSSQSILTGNKLTLFCEVTRLQDITAKFITAKRIFCIGGGAYAKCKIPSDITAKRHYF